MVYMRLYLLREIYSLQTGFSHLPHRIAGRGTFTGLSPLKEHMY